jgi:hypothetical protein
MSLALRSLLAVGVALCVASGASHAETKPKTEAQRHHELGLASMKDRAYGEAIAELNRAYDLGHDVAVLYDIAQAYVAMEQPVFAVTTFKKYLAEGGKHLPAARRKEVETAMAEQTRRIARVTVRATVLGAVVRVDGIEAGKTPLPGPLELGAGPHYLSASAEGYRPWEQPLELGGGEQREVEVRLEASDSPMATGATETMVVAPASAALPPPPAPDPLAPALSSPAAPPPAPPFPTRRVAAYALGGAGVVALTIGTIYGVRAIGKRHDSDANCPQNQCSQAGVELNDQAKTAARVADVTLAVGLVSAAVATYLWLTPAKPEAQAASAQRLRLAAGIGPHEAAIGVGGSW